MFMSPLSSLLQSYLANNPGALTGATSGASTMSTPTAPTRPTYTQEDIDFLLSQRYRDAETGYDPDETRRIMAMLGTPIPEAGFATQQWTGGAVPYNTWISNPAKYSAQPYRNETYGEESAQAGLDINQFMQDWEAGKALYADRNNTGIAAKDVYNPLMSFEQWLATNPNITTNPENDYMRSQYLIPTQKNDFLTDYGAQLAMALATAGTSAYAGGLGGAGAVSGATTSGGMAAADAAGLAQMGADAGLAGPALDSFVASGGTLGSTAVGGGGVGLGATVGSQPQVLPDSYWQTQAGAPQTAVPGAVEMPVAESLATDAAAQQAAQQAAYEAAAQQAVQQSMTLPTAAPAGAASPFTLPSWVGPSGQIAGGASTLLGLLGGGGDASQALSQYSQAASGASSVNAGLGGLYGPQTSLPNTGPVDYGSPYGGAMTPLPNYSSNPDPYDSGSGYIPLPNYGAYGPQTSLPNDVASGTDPLTMGETVTPWSTNPSLDDLGGNPGPYGPGYGYGAYGPQTSPPVGGTTPPPTTLPPVYGAEEVDGSQQTIYDDNANAGTPGYDPTLVNPNPSYSGSNVTPQAPTTTVPAGMWSRVMDGTATADDWARIAGQVVGPALGMYQANQTSNAISNAANTQAQALRDIAAQQFAIGAPHRERLNATYQPGFDPFGQPTESAALARAADVASRSWSTRGNPAGNPTLQAGIYRDVQNETVLPYLQNYRGQLGQFGGLGLNTSAQAGIAGANAANQGGLMSAQASGQGLNSLAAGLGGLLAPQPTMADIYRQYGLTIGGVSA